MIVLALNYYLVKTKIQIFKINNKKFSISLYKHVQSFSSKEDCLKMATAIQPF